MPVSILFVGDIHLGRAPSRLPEALGEAGPDPRDLGPDAAWRAAVDCACERGVDAVVLAGDVVDEANRRFEAFGPLHDGVRRLTGRGIEVLAVAGNHDGDVLPRLAAEAGLHLLGAGGTWSLRAVGPAGGPRARLLGWSFPSRRVTESPLAGDLPDLAGEGPVLGVLHCDLDAARSDYAPVRAAELAGRGVRQWFLGHVHRPTLREEGDEPGYLGSLTGLDPGEPGRRGPWLVTVADDGAVRRRHLPLAPLRWERLDVDLTGLDDPEQELLPRLHRALRELAARLAGELEHARALGCRVRLTGRVARRRELARQVAVVAADGLQFTVRDTALFVERVVDATRPDRDLESLAAGSDPPALLAADLLALEQGGAAAAGLIAAARARLAGVAEQPAFARLEPWDADRATVRELLLRSGYRTLDELLAQGEAEA